MAKNRKAATEFLLDFIDSLVPGSPNKAIYEERLAEMSDADFDKWMHQLETEEVTLVFYSPEELVNKATEKSSPGLSVERNLAIAKKLGYDFFQHAILTDPDTGIEFRTNEKYLLIDLPQRRQAQTLEAKASIPENDQHTDQLTDQPTGPSKGAKISNPELQILYAQGFDRVIEEAIKFRGGDTKAYQALKTLATTDGVVSQDVIKQMPTRVKSTEVLSTILTTMHLENKL